MIAGKLNAAALAGLAGLAALAVAGCGSSAPSTGAPAKSGKRLLAPAAEITRAADVSESAKGLALRMSLVEMKPNGHTVRISGSGAFVTASHSGRLDVTIQAAGQSQSVEELILGDKLYEKLPASAAAQIPGGKPWLELDLGALASKSQISNLSSLGSGSLSDPADELSYLKAEATKVQDLGAATVDGIMTTHYRLTLDLDKAAAAAPASARAAIHKLLSQLPGKIVNATAVPADVWIDAAQRVRRLTLTETLLPRGSAQPVTAAVSIDITSYGPQPTPTPPPADQTTNLLALLRSLSGAAGSGGATVTTPLGG
jgi:hypothetical protein